MKPLALIVFFIFSGMALVLAQTNCTEQLRQAERRFDEGLLDDIPQMIKSCMTSGFTKEEKVNAYKLLIQTYLFSDDKQKADEEMLKFLKNFPEYSIVSTDTKEFVNLHNTYRTEPILRIEPYLGLNLSMPYVFEYFSVGDLNTNVPEYFSNLGLSLGVNYTDQIYKNIDGSLGLSFLFSRVGYYNQVFDYTFVEGTYTELYIGIPLSARYYFKLKGFEMFAKGGVETAYLLKSQNDLTRAFATGGDNIVATVDLTGYHKKFDIRPFVGVGFSPRFGNVKLLVETGFRFGTIIPVDKDLRYANNETIEKFYLIEDNWIFNHFFFNISYVFSIYKPTKIQ